MRVLSIPLGLIGALAVALLLNQNVKGVGYWRTLYYLPAVLPAAAVALLWCWLFAPNSGLINWALGPIYDLINCDPLGWFTDQRPRAAVVCHHELVGRVRRQHGDPAGRT